MRDRMPLQQALDALRSDRALRTGFVEWRELDEQPARFAAYDASAITYGMPSAALTRGPSQSGAL